MKIVNGRAYVHRSAINQLPEVARERADQLIAVLEYLHGAPDVVSFNLRDPDPKKFQFSWCDDFDGIPEPSIIVSATIEADSITPTNIRRYKNNQQIFHGKELLVDSSYTGFDLKKAAERRAKYLSFSPSPIHMGRKDWWTKWLTSIPQI